MRELPLSVTALLLSILCRGKEKLQNSIEVVAIRLQWYVDNAQLLFLCEQSALAICSMLQMHAAWCFCYYRMYEQRKVNSFL